MLNLIYISHFKQICSSLFNLHPCLSSLFVPCSCFSLFIHSFRSTFSSSQSSALPLLDSVLQSFFRPSQYPQSFSPLFLPFPHINIHPSSFVLLLSLHINPPFLLFSYHPTSVHSCFLNLFSAH